MGIGWGSSRRAAASGVTVDPRDQLVLDEARRGIDQQKDDLAGIRTRASATIAYATVIAAFIGGQSLREINVPTAWTWLGLASLAAAAACSTFVLAPRVLTLVLDVEGIDKRIADGDDVSAVLRATAYALARDYDKNAVELLKMQRAYILSQLAVLTMVALLLTDLARR